MKEETKLLEVGDRVYYQSNYGITSVHEVDRVTPKRAYIDSYEFEREVSKYGNLNLRGRSNGRHYSVSYWSLATPELDAKWKEQKARAKLKTLTDGQNKWPIGLVEAAIKLINTATNL